MISGEDIDALTEYKLATDFEKSAYINRASVFMWRFCMKNAVNTSDVTFNEVESVAEYLANKEGKTFNAQD